MEKLILIIFILLLNALYWIDFIKTFENTSENGTWGKSMIGFILLGVSLFLLFQLDYLLR